MIHPVIWDKKKTFVENFLYIYYCPDVQNYIHQITTYFMFFLEILFNWCSFVGMNVIYYSDFPLPGHHIQLFWRNTKTLCYGLKIWPLRFKTAAERINRNCMFAEKSSLIISQNKSDQKNLGLQMCKNRSVCP